MLLYTRLYQFRHGKVVFTEKLSLHRIHNHLAITFSVYTSSYAILQHSHNHLTIARQLIDIHLHHDIRWSHNSLATVNTAEFRIHIVIIQQSYNSLANHTTVVYTLANIATFRMHIVIIQLSCSCKEVDDIHHVIIQVA